jgi:transposase
VGPDPETLRTWIREDEADRGERDDRPTTDEQQELRELRKRVRELERANEILKAASAYFAQEPGPTRQRS